jgi:hypothetical protein
MDVLAEALENADQERDEGRATFFADDVQLRARNRESLAKMLKVCEEWADQNDMKWSTKKCSTIHPEEDQQPFTFCDSTLSVVRKADYLGVTLTEQGIRDDNLLDRVRNARGRLEMLKRIGMNAKAFGPMLCKSLYITFVRSMHEYCSHITPISDETRDAYLSLEKSFFGAASGVYNAPLIWYRKLFKIEPMRVRRQKLAAMLKNRASECQHFHGPTLQWALEQADNATGVDNQTLIWWQQDKHKKRPLPLPDNGLLPAFFFRKHKHRVLSMKWYLHRFPYSPTKVREVMALWLGCREICEGTTSLIRPCACAS